MAFADGDAGFGSVVLARAIPGAIGKAGDRLPPVAYLGRCPRCC
jgi:hypothetical protein